MAVSKNKATLNKTKLFIEIQVEGLPYPGGNLYPRANLLSNYWRNAKEKG